ncbi:MAG: hypothetical protein JWO03_178 [Bacteroidetes bacterium]|nr:hypothetical protein [Bacteroidota bacterium]
MFYTNLSETQHNCMKYLFILALTVSLTGCVSYSQIFQTSYPNLGGSSTGLPVFENDTVRIQYYFWENDGMLVFYVYNKLDKPLYIDWKKSSYIKNGDKLDYWSDETDYVSATYSSSVYGRSILWNNANVSVGESVTYGKSKKPERTTFIAPHSSYTRSTPFYLYHESTELALPKNARSEEWISGFNQNKKVQVRYVNFTKEKSPLTFRNFLSISTSEKFENEVYIDNEFFVSRITELPYVELHGPSINYSSGSFEYPFKKPDRFYVNLSSGSFK